MTWVRICCSSRPSVGVDRGSLGLAFLRGVVTGLVVPDAQGDQVFDRGGVDVAGDDRDDHRVIGDGAGGVTGQPGPAIPGTDGGGGAAGGPLGPVGGDPRVLQDRVLLHGQQFGEVDVRQRLDRLSSPPGQQVRGQQPPHRLGQGVVVALRPGPQIPATLRSGQRIQHRRHHRGALRGQIASQHSRAVDRGVQGYGTVPPRVIVRVIIGVGGCYAFADRGAERG